MVFFGRVEILGAEGSGLWWFEDRNRLFRVSGIHAGVGFLLVRVLHFFGVVGLAVDLPFWFGAEGRVERA